MESILSNPDTGNREPELFVVVLWTLWNRRNNLHLGKPTLSLGQVVAWQAQVQDAYKVNFDGAVFVEEGLVGLGVVIHNNHELIMASLTQQIPLLDSIIEVEVLVARKALELTLELGFDNITFEGDFEVLIKSLAKGGNSLAHYGHLIADIQILMARFSSLSLSHVRRHCNSLAHALAQRASFTSDLSIWMEEIPPNLNFVYMADLSGLS
ncbi:uncharacterized protein LOC115964723 [Quercus lobata]|uniref:uncharacterized protein LOC115964723 n=1 Tax=Quercus lobata TaxID=97700 RepID=UPI001248F66F|nr:uncharacterized protein LOC115964723 [Quercus lobata]